MTRFAYAITLFSLLMIAAPTKEDSGGDFDGQWHTSAGTVTLKQMGTEVTGSYGKASEFTLHGKVEGKKLTFEYQEGKAQGEASWTLDDKGLSFRGQFKIRGGPSGRWEGWRRDPDATKANPISVAGLWLTDMGLMEFEQDGDQVRGRYALRGVSEIKGTVTGRRLEFTYKSFRPGTGWFDVSAEGDAFGGAAVTGGFANWYGWQGRRAPEFTRHTKLVAGQIVDGSTKGLLTYSIRAPENYQPDKNRKWPAIVILHGSNMNGKAYVNTIATSWPEIAKDYLLIGINGETPSNIGDEPRFNYTYINFMGRSTYQGFPGTDRESPALVAEALDDLREAYSIEKYFVGGHSQGGFLTYCLLMHFPERIAGAFPISAGLLMQCEPKVFSDEKLRAAQRSVPLAIVHGKNDLAVDFRMGQSAANAFGEAGWPAFHFFADKAGAGHMFAHLPVDEAIHWLEAHSSNDPARLLAFAEKQMKADQFRDAVAAIRRANSLQPTDPDIQARLDRLAKDINAKAGPGAIVFLPKIREAKTGETWIDEFLVYRDQFEFASAASDVMQAFDALRVDHDRSAKEKLKEATAAFRQEKRDDGYAKYQQIVDQYYAAESYRKVKQWLAERN